MINIVRKNATPKMINNIKLVKKPKVAHSNAHDLLNKKFGDYLVVGKDGSDKSGHILWKCECPSCGDTFSTTAYELMHGRKNTCCKHCHHFSLNDIDNINNNIDNSVDNSVDNNNIVKDTNIYHNTDENTDYICIAKNVYYREIKEDLLSMPAYYHIAHCIPADLSFYGETAKRISSFYSLKNKLENDFRDACGIVPLYSNTLIDNVFTLFPTIKKHTHATLSGVEEMLRNFATDCHNIEVKYLAMPKICCGHNGLNWDDVKDIVINEFSKAYQDNNEDNTVTPIFITVCYN